MKRIAVFAILLVSFVILSPDAKAQWEGAQLVRLTGDDLPNKIVGLYISANDKLDLIYAEGVRDTITGFVYDYRLLHITKDKGGDWSEPEEIPAPVYIVGQNRKSVVRYDTRTGITHIVYVSYPLFGCAETLYYANSDVPGWEPVKMDSIELGHGYILPDLELDSLGNAHVIWSVSYLSGGVSSGEIVYANNSTGEWVKQAAWVGAGVTSLPALAVEKDGTVHIAHGGPGLEDCYYTRNDGLNGENWETDTIPRPTIPLCSHRYAQLLADAFDEIHLLTRGYSCVGDTIFEFYYHKEAHDTQWSSPDLVQVHPPDSGMIRGYFADRQGYLHFSLTHFGGFNVIYTNNESGSWSEPELLLYEGDAPGAGWSFMFVIDSEGQGHGVFKGFDPSQSFWDEDSFEVYYFSTPSTSVDFPQHHPISHFKLFQNHPNPFNSSTIIAYDNPRGAKVVLRIYDVLGREVRELVNRWQEAGHYMVGWDGRNNQGEEVASGVYFYQLHAGDYTETRKSALIK
jgi:hypothetical protein